MKCLVIFHSKYGQTEKIARRIGDSLRSREVAVEVISVDKFDKTTPVASFDMIVVGAPIYAEHYSKEIARFIEDHRAELGAKSSVFFSVSLSSYGNQDQKRDAERCASEFLGKTGWSPRLVGYFAGALPYRKYNWLIRWLMKRMVRKAGGDTDTSKNHEYTDWEQVDKFATDLFELVSGNANCLNA
jgi:menaquinone-dependent protoporphyrinogen oxidase